MHNFLRYVNHQNKEIIFSYKGLHDTGILIESDTLRDYKYTINTLYKKVSSFQSDIAQYSFPITIAGDDAREKANVIHEIVESDLLTNNKGRLYLGDYYIEGFFYGSSKTLVTHSRVCRMNLMFVSDRPVWTKEDRYVYRTNSTEIGEGHDYPYDYPYNYISRMAAKTIHNNTFKEQDMEINIYGPVNTPVITIGGKKYGADVQLLSGEYLTLNTRNKTVVKTNRIGEKINCFSKRVKTEYAFQKLAVGANQIISQYASNFDITVLIERSEPEWI